VQEEELELARERALEEINRKEEQQKRKCNEEIRDEKDRL